MKAPKKEPKKPLVKGKKPMIVIAIAPGKPRMAKGEKAKASKSGKSNKSC